MFYTKTPANFTQIDEVKLQDGKLTILNHSGETLILAASRVPD